MDSTQTSICRDIAPQLDAFHDGELQGNDQARVEKHLAVCAACVNQLAEIDRLVHTLKTLPKVEVSSKFSADLDKLIDEQGKVMAFRPRVWMPIAAAAAVVALVIGAKYMAPGTTNSPVTANNTMPNTGTIQQTVKPETTVQQPKVAAKQDTPTPGITPAVSSQQGKAVVATRPVQQAPVSAEPKSLQKIEPMIQQQSPQVATVNPKHAAHTQDEIAEVPSGSLNGFNEAVGIATDEDGLYDLKM